MATDNPIPTVVIGSGKAGIAVLNSIAELAESEGERDAFEFIAVDSNNGELQNRPEGAARIYLQNPEDSTGRDIGAYPYLTGDMSLEQKGAERQRPVGRYKLDNDRVPTFRQHFNKIERRVLEHYRDNEEKISPSRQSLNVFLVHSLGGGTGSGTFPLLTAMAQEVANSVDNEFGVFTYTSTIGVIPEISLMPGNAQVPGLPGDKPIYYANSYAGLRDVSSIISRAGEPGFHVPVYSTRKNGSGERLGADERNSIPITETPDHMFLVGVDETRIRGQRSAGRRETYADMINRTVAEGVYAISKYGESMENWVMDGGKRAHLSSMDQREVAVPIEGLRGYCDLEREIREIERQLYAGGLSELRDEGVDVVEHIVRNPEAALKSVDDPDEVEQEISDSIEINLGAGRSLLDRTPDEVHDVADTIEDEHGLQLVPLMLDKLQSRYDELTADIKDTRAETVDELWDAYEMDSKPGITGSVSSVKVRFRQLEEELEAQLDDLQEDLEEADPSFWDSLPVISGARETLEGRISVRRSDLGELGTVQRRYEQLQELTETIDSERRQTKRALRRRRNSLDDKKRERSRLADRLTDRERPAYRVAYLPIREEKLETLDPETLKELESIDDFLNSGYIRQSDLENALERQLTGSKAWENTALDFNITAGLEEIRTRYEVWFLHSEANSAASDLPELPSDIDDFRRSGAGVRYIPDPYRLKFVSYHERGPVEGLEMYQALDAMADNGSLDEFLDGEDHRRSFAYMEWYDRHIKQAFNIRARVELPFPPELDIDDLTDIGESEGERKNAVVTNGLSLYLLNGRYWKKFAGQTSFDGWGEALDEFGVGFPDIQQASPEARVKSRWVDGAVDWEEVVEAYTRNLADREGIKIELVEPEEAVGDD